MKKKLSQGKEISLFQYFCNHIIPECETVSIEHLQIEIKVSYFN